MEEILILYHGGFLKSPAITRTAFSLDRVRNAELRIGSTRIATTLSRFQRGRLAAAVKSGRSVVTLRFDRAQKMTALRKRGLRVATALSVNPDGPPSATSTQEVKELLSAVLANSHACRNWLADPEPNIDRARQSIAHVTRDLQLVAQLV